MGTSNIRGLLGALAGLALLGCGGRASDPLRITLEPPASAMPVTGQRVVFRVAAQGSGAIAYQWLKDGLDLAGAVGDTLVLGPVGPGDAGVYQVQVSAGSGTLLTPPFALEPVDHPWVVTSAAGSGPGSLPAVLGAATGHAGVNGIQFAVAGTGPVTITLEDDLPAITGAIVILGPNGRALTVDGGGAHRPFFLQSGSLVLEQFTVAHGLGKGGDGLGGGGGAGGMGGGLFINGGSVTLKRMVFQDNVAQGGSSAPGSDGSNGGGGGFGGDSAAAGGAGGGGGYLGGTGAPGVLDGSGDGLPGIHGAGGGAARGGELVAGSFPGWTSDLAGGYSLWGGGGGFGVGPEGGGGQALGIGGGGGGCGGRVPVSVFPLGGSLTGLLPGAAASGGTGAFLGGNGSAGDGLTAAGQGGGGGGMGGALFLRAGTLTMTQCRFVGNQALPGTGAERGFGKGGALFIYAFPYATDPATGQGLPFDQAPGNTLKGQSYSANVAPDASVEDAAFDNADYYVAQDILATLAHDSPLARLYQSYRQGLGPQ